MRLTSVSASICCLALAAVAVTEAAVPPNQRAARRAAAALVAALRLPSGAVSVPDEPASDQGRLRPMLGLTSSSARVDRHAWWRVPGTPAQVVGYIEAHPPQGGQLEESMVGPGERGVGYRWPVPPGLASRRLAVTAVALSSTTTGVLAQGEAVWIVPRSASERIPVGVREVDVTSRPLGGSTKTALTVTKPRPVHRLVALIDALPIVQPAVVNCPAEGLPGPGDWVIDLVFRARAGGRPLARAHYLDFAPVDTPSGPCTPVDFSIRARARTPLLGGNFVGRLDHLLGTRLTR